MNTTPPAQITIPIDIPNVDIIETTHSEAGWSIVIRNQTDTVPCGVCQETILCNHGTGRIITLRHLPILGQATYIKIAPKRGKCPNCPHSPTTTQQVDWYEAHSPHTIAYDKYLMRQLKGSTVMDVSLMENVGYDAILGALKREVPAEVNWDEIEDLGTLGIDEVATQKGRKKYRAVITARQSNGKRCILAVLPNRKKNGQGVLR